MNADEFNTTRSKISDAFLEKAVHFSGLKAITLGELKNMANLAGEVGAQEHSRITESSTNKTT